MSTENFLRRHKMAYKDQNGFIDPFKLRAQGLSPEFQNTDATPTPREQIDAAQRHLLAMHVLETKGSYFPGLEEMKAALEAPDTSASVKSQQTDIRDKHREELSELFEYQSQQYLTEAMDRYLSNDESIEDPDINKFYESLHGEDHPYNLDNISDWESYRYSYLRANAPLLKQHAELSAHEQAIQRHQDAQFPLNLDQYHSITNKETQLRVAKFLTSDATTKERLMSEFGWAWRQVGNLEHEFSDNLSFKAEIGERLRELEATDPRRRPSLTAAGLSK